MRTLTICLFLFFISPQIVGQGISVGLSYNYLYAKSLNKCIDVYNFSRPFLVDKQPRFIHGITGHLSYSFKKNKKTENGISVSYAHFGSEAKNTNYKNRFNFHLIHLNYFIRLLPLKKCNRFLGEFHLGLISSLLNRGLNNKWLIVYDNKLKSVGIGGYLGLKMSYYLNAQNKPQWAPFILLGYSPYIYAPNNEAVINATQQLITNTHLNIYHINVGISYQMNKKKN